MHGEYIRKSTAFGFRFRRFCSEENRRAELVLDGTVASWRDEVQ